MLNMEQTYDGMIALSVKLEDTIKSEIAKKREGAEIGIQTSILDNEVRLADMAMETKNSLSQSRIKLEEYVQMTSLKDLAPIEAEYRATIDDFDSFIDAILNGGDTEEGHVNAAQSQAVREVAEEIDKQHNQRFQTAAMVTRLAFCSIKLNKPRAGK
jgi:hypothetical protein